MGSPETYTTLEAMSTLQGYGEVIFFLFLCTTEIKNNFLGKMGTFTLVREQYYMVELLKEWTWEITAEHDLTPL